MADSHSPFDVLEAYLRARASFSAEELAFVRTMFRPRHLAAGDFLQRAGDVARHAAFVARGCLRSYVIDAKGREHVVQFAPEQWWLADAISLNTGTPSQYFFAAIEDSDLLLIDAPAHQQIVDRVPATRRRCAPAFTSIPPPRIYESSRHSAQPRRSATWTS